MSELIKNLSTINKPKLLDQVRAAIRTKHYSIRTEESYVSWVKRFILFHEKKYPNALSVKYINAAKERVWQYVFPASKISTDPRSGIRRRHHIYETVLQKAVKQAIRKAGIVKQASCHILFEHRHFDILSRHIYSKLVITYTKYSFFSGTTVLKQHRYIHTHIIDEDGPGEVRSLRLISHKDVYTPLEAV